MRLFPDPNRDRWEQDATNFAVGAIAGLAIGVLVSRVMKKPHALNPEFRERAKTAARRLRPARLRRLGFEQQELDRLELAVLNTFVADPILGERGIDIGAVSPGIVELIGSVASEQEAQRAVSMAGLVPGVKTVVNRMQVEEVGRRGGLRPRLETGESRATFEHQEARVRGMGRRRQGVSTDPERMDDSQVRRSDALAAADREQWADEGYTTGPSPVGDRPEARPANRTNFSEDELDNQDPHGKHAEFTLDSQPQELRSESRVGDTPKPGTRRDLERADLSIDGTTPRDQGD
jgi:hypothetical protein